MSRVDDDHPRLTEAMERYLEALESGNLPDRDQFLAEYEDIADELAGQLTSLEMLFQVGTELKNQPASEPTEKQGQTLGDFRLMRPIGRGGMGIVYEAEQISLQRRVAVKILPLANMLDADQLKRFRNEARTAATLDHPNIVPVYFVGQERGVHFYAMQLIEGSSLADVIRDMAEDEDSSFTLQASGEDTAKELHADLSTERSSRPREFFRSVAKMGAQAAEALEHAHRLGVVHRDIKPGNLLLDSSGKLWVTDFGLASWEHNESLTRTGGIVGTVAYMSPEQAAGSRMIDLRTDVYSLGATLYELILLNRPASDATTQVWREKSEPGHVSSLRSRDPRVPIDLETIVLKALSLEPEDRYQTARDLADDLNRFVQDEPIKARRLSYFDRSIRWLRHRTATAAIVSVAALLTLSVVVAALAFHAQQLSMYTEKVEGALEDKEEALTRANQAQLAANTQRQRAEQSELRARQMGYRSDMQLAFDRRNTLDFPAAHRLVSRQVPSAGEPDVRGFEWALLHAQLSAEVTELVRHNGPATECAIFPDARHAASVGEDGMVHLFDLEKKELVKSFAPGIGPIHSLAISPDGKTLAIGGEPSLKTLDLARVYILDAESGERIGAVHRHHTSIDSIAFSPDGSLIASGARYQDVSVSTVDEKFVGSLPAKRRNDTICFTPDGRQIASLQERNTLQFWDFEQKEIKRTLDLLPEGHSVHEFVWSPTERKFAIARNGFPYAYVVGVDDGARLRQLTPPLPYPRQFSSIEWRPDGQRIVAGDTDGKIHLFGETGERPLYSATLIGGRVTDVGITEDDHVLATGDDGAVMLLAVGRNAIDRVPLRIHVTAGALAGDSLIVGTAIGRIRRFAHPTSRRSELIARLSEDPIEDVAVSAENESIAAVDDTGRVMLIDSAGKSLWTPIDGGETGVQRVAISPDGQYLAHAGYEGVFRLWHIPSRRTVLTRKLPRKGSAVAFSPDGTIVACGADRVRLFEVESGSLLVQLTGGDTTYDLSFSSSGEYLATACWDGSIRLHNLREESSRVLKGHRHYARSIAFSPDDRSLISIDAGQFEDSLRIWSVATGETFGAVPNPMLPKYEGNSEARILLNHGQLVILDPPAPQPALFHFEFK